MIKIQMIGNLAADAEIKNANGRDWLTFRLADTRRWSDAQGNAHEETQWASCIMQNTQGNLAQYLKKGVKVFIEGDCSIEIYSSPKLRCMVGRYNINVRSVELCGGQIETVPKHLVSSNGEIIDTYKAYYIDTNRKDLFGQNLYGERSGLYQVNEYGFVIPVSQTTEVVVPSTDQGVQQAGTAVQHNTSQPGTTGDEQGDAPFIGEEQNNSVGVDFQKKLANSKIKSHKK